MAEAAEALSVRPPPAAEDDGAEITVVEAWPGEGAAVHHSDSQDDEDPFGLATPLDVGQGVSASLQIAVPPLGNIWPEYAESSSEDDEALMLHDSNEANLLWGQMKMLLVEHGLVGQLLATQEGDIHGLLDVLLAELKADVNASAKATLLDRLMARVDDAVQEQVSKTKLAGSGPMAAIHLPRIRDAVAAKDATGMTVVSLPLHLHRPLRGRRRKTATVKLGTQDDAADEGPDRELLKWRERLADILVKADTPTARKASLTVDAQVTIMRAAGKARASTIKKYVCTWERMTRWLQRAKGTLWPTAVEQLLDYANVLAQGTRPTVPETTLKALRWMEQVAGIPEPNRCTADPLLKRAFETVSLENPGSAKKQAPRPPGALLASFELSLQMRLVPAMKRIDMGCLLFRSFGTLRFDDQQHIDPRKLRVLGNMIVTELMQTKTSGPGRRNKELPLALHRQATILGTDWVANFLEDLKQSCPEKRSYLQPGSTGDWKGSTHTRKTYEEAAADFAVLLGEATIPVWHDGKWQPSDELVIPAACIGAFTLHGVRALIPSIMALIERDKVLRDLLGRWMATGGSHDYTRTYRKAVAEMQLAAADSFRSSRMTGDLREDDIGDSMRRFLIEKSMWTEERADALVAATMLRWDRFYRELAEHYVATSTGVAEDQLQRWEVHELRAELRGSEGEVPEDLQDLKAAEPETQEDASESEAAILDAAEPEEDLNNNAVKRRKRVQRPEKFLITYNRGRKLARLHRTTDRCPWAKLELKDFTMHDTVVPEMYDRRCRLCWPNKAEDSEAMSESDTSSESD